MWEAEESRFYDGGSLDGTVPAGDPTPIVLLLRDVAKQPPRRETFILQRRIAYRARWRGDDLDIIVPAAAAQPPPDDKVFRSDLTSVPAFFTWLVPRTGCHLPAALIHDGLIYDRGEPASYEAPEAVSRIQADRILRDAMADLGTGAVRRWLMWAAVSIATVAAGVTDQPEPYRTTTFEEASPREKPRADRHKDLVYRIGVFGSLILIAALGIAATVDLFDWWNGLFWMGKHSTWHELGFGAVGALALPLVLSLGWFRLWRAGLIAGWALAFLLHVTLALIVLTALYQGLEWLAQRFGHLAREPGRREDRLVHPDDAAGTAPEKSEADGGV